jgi:hypothetical protein
MFVFNGKKYAKNDAEFTSSLFDAGGTCSGFYKRTKNGIRLFNMQREPLAFIVTNESRYFLVNMGEALGKLFYQYSIGDLQLNKLGFKSRPTITQENEMIREAMKQFA